MLSKGPENDQVINLARQFIEQYRASIMAIFKRNAKIGSAQANTTRVLEELVDNFTILITASGFLEVSLKAPLHHFGGFADSGAERE